MTSLEFFNDYISTSCHKVKHDYYELSNIKKLDGLFLVKATTLYQIYKHNTFGADGKRLSMKEFFRVAGQYLYYDKYVCAHGTEYYYYVIFNPDNYMYQLTKEVVIPRIEVNGPESLSDLQHIVPAMTKI